MIEFIKNIDTALFLAINKLNHPFADVIMGFISHKYTWIPLYVLLAFFIYKSYQKKIILIIPVVALLIFATDQISVHCFKEVFQRYRPCHNELIKNQIHLVNGCGGQYGFVSSHAANTFALAFFVTMLLKSKIKHIGYYLFFWASIVSYSRIYNGVHYPLDVFVGGIVGVGISILLLKLYYKLDYKLFNSNV